MKNAACRAGRRRDAFTLIELTLVVAIAAVFAAVVAVSLKGPYARARLKNAAERIELVDRQLRDHARRFDRPAELLIDFRGNTLTTVHFGDEEVSARTFRPGGGVRIDQLVCGNRLVEYGRATIRFSARGRTPTYAVRLRGAAGGEFWLMFIGSTGQIIRIDDVEEIENILDLVSARRNNAD